VLTLRLSGSLPCCPVFSSCFVKITVKRLIWCGRCARRKTLNAGRSGVGGVVGIA
jgi:hypothetical protein